MTSEVSIQNSTEDGVSTNLLNGARKVFELSCKVRQ